MKASAGSLRKEEKSYFRYTRLLAHVDLSSQEHHVLRAKQEDRFLLKSTILFTNVLLENFSHGKDVN